MRRPEQKFFEVWEANLECVVLFRELETQWRRIATLTGAVRDSLIYSEAIALMREKRIPRARRVELLEDLRLMERAALRAQGAEAEDD